MARAEAIDHPHARSTPRRPKTSTGGQESGVKGRLASARASLERYALFRVLESTATGFAKDRVTNYAAAMTYYGIFSLFPLLLLFMSLAGLALQSNESAREQMMSVVVGLLPQGQEQLKQVVEGVIDTKGIAAGIGILTLLWGALGWFQVIDNTVNQIWGVDKPRSFIKAKLFALAMVAAIGGVALASWAATAAIGILAAFTDVIPGTVLLWQALVSLLSVLTITGAFLVLYRYTPRRRIELADVWPAALATAVAWEGTRRLLAFYLEQNNMISGYGPIGAAMALLFWIYVTSIIVLTGAELAYAIAKERRHIGPHEEMQVAAPRGEQPTPKFAPQVGRGFDTADDREPIRAVPTNALSTKATPFATDGHQGPPEARFAHNGVSRAAAKPRSKAQHGSWLPKDWPDSVKGVVWAGLAAGTVALTSLAARRLSAGIWESVTHQPPPTPKA
jgi:membrane protein